MLRSIPGSLLTEWMAFAELEPFGQEWLQSGTIAAMVANTHIDLKKHDWIEPEDIIPGYRKPEPEPEPEKVAAKMDRYFSALAAATATSGI
jgi:hypothetical protein